MFKCVCVCVGKCLLIHLYVYLHRFIYISTLPYLLCTSVVSSLCIEHLVFYGVRVWVRVYTCPVHKHLYIILSYLRNFGFVIYIPTSCMCVIISALGVFGSTGVDDGSHDMLILASRLYILHSFLSFFFSDHDRYLEYGFLECWGGDET